MMFVAAILQRVTLKPRSVVLMRPSGPTWPSTATTVRLDVTRVSLDLRRKHRRRSTRGLAFRRMRRLSAQPRVEEGRTRAYCPSTRKCNSVALQTRPVRAAKRKDAVGMDANPSSWYNDLPIHVCAVAASEVLYIQPLGARHPYATVPPRHARGCEVYVGAQTSAD